MKITILYSRQSSPPSPPHTGMTTAFKEGDSEVVTPSRAHGSKSPLDHTMLDATSSLLPPNTVSAQDVAVQAEFEKKELKPLFVLRMRIAQSKRSRGNRVIFGCLGVHKRVSQQFDCIGTRVETRRFRASYGSAVFWLYSPNQVVRGVTPHCSSHCATESVWFQGCSQNISSTPSRPAT
jgi:hypothetical protein